MNDKEKLKVIKHYLEEIYKDSREYMDDFYEQCKDGVIIDLEEVVEDKIFDEFMNNQELKQCMVNGGEMKEKSTHYHSEMKTKSFFIVQEHMMFK